MEKVNGTKIEFNSTQTHEIAQSANGHECGNLKQAMMFSQARSDTSEDIKERAVERLKVDSELIESQLEEEVAKKLDEVFGAQTTDADEFWKEASFDIKPNTSDRNITARILELNRRRKSNEQVLKNVQTCMKNLKTMSQEASMVSQYLVKSEHEIEQLELVESQHQRLVEVSRAMLAKLKQNKVQNTAYYEQIGVLESAQKKNRLLLENSNAEINELKDQCAKNLAELKSKNAEISNFKDSISDIQEKHSHLTAQRDELVMEGSKIRETNELLGAKLLETQNTLSCKLTNIEQLSEENAQMNLEVQNIHAINETKESELATVKWRLDEALHLLSSERAAGEERDRLKEARILKAESRIELLEKQLFISEDVISELRYEINTLKKPAIVVNAANQIQSKKIAPKTNSKMNTNLKSDLH